MATTTTKTVFTENALSYQGVYYHFNGWRKDGYWKKSWVTLLHLDLSSIQLDGSHTGSQSGETAIGYQGRKAVRTTNLLFSSW